MDEFTKDFDSFHNATERIRSLEGDIIRLNKEKAEEEEKVKCLQKLVDDLEHQLYSKKPAEEDTAAAPKEGGPIGQEGANRLAGMQNLLESSIKAATKLEEDNKKLQSDNKRLEAENAELHEQLENLKSSSEEQSPTAAKAKKNAKKKDVSQLVNETIHKSIVTQIKFVFGRHCKFVHTPARLKDLAKAVYCWAKKEHTLNEKTYDEFFEVYEHSIKGGVTAHRQYVQQQTQKAAFGE